jgi:hypothetical protein
VNWRRFFKRAQADAEQQQELESYIEITAEEYIARGMPVDEARRAAQRKLGNLTRIREEVYQMNTATFVEGTLREIRHAVRMLRTNPAFSITASLTLTLGIGATTAIFSVVYGVVIKPLPYPDADALVTVGVSAVFGTERTPNFPLAPGCLLRTRRTAARSRNSGCSVCPRRRLPGWAVPSTSTRCRLRAAF